MTKEITPYKGNEKYVFVSYCHKDSAKVYPIIAALQKKGCRIWYDDGINPGEEWPEVIAEKLSGAQLCIAFISSASLMSHNCRKEVNFAVSRQKNLLIVFLEKTELTPGLELQLSTVQAIKEYEGCVEKIMTVSGLESCMGEPSAADIVYTKEESPEDEKTVYYAPEKAALLVLERTGTEYLLKDAVTYIGRSGKMCEIAIGDNPKLSRQHAAVMCRNGTYYISDMKSTNHTYLNGRILSENDENRLSDGDKIRLGNEEFVFRIKE